MKELIEVASEIKSPVLLPFLSTIFVNSIGNVYGNVAPSKDFGN